MFLQAMKNSAILLITCPDQQGLVSVVANLLYKYNGNVLHADQHIDTEEKLFFMRVEWDLGSFSIDMEHFKEEFKVIAEQYKMRWQLQRSAQKLNTAIFVSKQDHCLADLLYRHRAGELACELKLIISNHADTQSLADFYSIPFHHIPISKTSKPETESVQKSLLDQHDIDLIVLARYMQILSPQFITDYPDKIINIHHSFLPAFLGAKPYHRAFERGVKLIGATSHYVTAELDNGPIIEQNVLRVSHRDQVNDLVRKGQDIEKTVLSRAVRLHLEHRILTYGNKTVIFD
jgi:formyltetrahydrofolate deformylase